MFSYFSLFSIINVRSFFRWLGNPQLSLLFNLVTVVHVRRSSSSPWSSAHICEWGAPRIGSSEPGGGAGWAESVCSGVIWLRSLPGKLPVGSQHCLVLPLGWSGFMEKAPSPLIGERRPGLLASGIREQHQMGLWLVQSACVRRILSSLQ